MVELVARLVPTESPKHALGVGKPEHVVTAFRAGYDTFDCVRPEIRTASDVMPWYRYNSLIFANAEGQMRLSREALSARVADPAKLDGGGDLAWRLRKLVLRPLPVGVVSWMSRVHYSIACALARRQAGAGA